VVCDAQPVPEKPQLDQHHVDLGDQGRPAGFSVRQEADSADGVLADQSQDVPHVDPLGL
jgi:hypothetical protein